MACHTLLDMPRTKRPHLAICQIASRWQFGPDYFDDYPLENHPGKTHYAIPRCPLMDFLASPQWNRPVEFTLAIGVSRPLLVLTRLTGLGLACMDDALFDAPVALKGPLTFVRCKPSPETWLRHGRRLSSFYLSGFHVRLLDEEDAHVYQCLLPAER